MSHERKTTVRQAITGSAAALKSQPIAGRQSLVCPVKESPELGARDCAADRNNALAPASAPQRPQVYNFDAQGVRVVGPWDTPRFVAKDICDILEIQNHRDTLAKVLESDEKGVDTVYTLGGPQEMLTVNESGLYALIFRSRKPEARLFRRWVTGTVLPAIRRTGTYQAPAPAVRIHDPRAEYYHLLKELTQHQGLPGRPALPGPDHFPPGRWQPVFAEVCASCRYMPGRSLSSVDLATKLRERHPEFTVKQILRALPWMIVQKFGVSRSNDIRFDHGRYRRGYRNLAWVAMPLLSGGAS